MRHFLCDIWLTTKTDPSPLPLSRTVLELRGGDPQLPVDAAHDRGQRESATDGPIGRLNRLQELHKEQLGQRRGAGGRW